MSDTKDILEMSQDEIHHLVVKLAKAAHESMVDLIKPYDDRHSFLLYGRALNFLYARHFGLALELGHKKIDDIENPQPKRSE